MNSFRGFLVWTLFVCLATCASAEEQRVFFPDKRDNVEEWCRKSKIVYNPQRNISTYDYCDWVYTEINKLRAQEEKMGLSMVVYSGLKKQKDRVESELPSSAVTQTVFSALNRIAIEFETIVTYTNGLFLIGRREKHAYTGKDPFLALPPGGGTGGAR